MVSYRYPGPIGIHTYWGNPIDRDTLARESSHMPGILEGIREGRRLMLERLKTATGHESRIAAILRSGNADHIDFTIENVSVNKELMEMVATAIEDGSVKIELKDSGKTFRAIYTSWVGHIPSPETNGRIGRLTIKASALYRTQGQIDIFHESVHALRDIFRYQIDRHQNEALAYVADTMFWLSAQPNKAFPTTGDAGPIYAASQALVGSKGMMKNRGTALQWSDCDALIDAIKLVPEYK